MMYTISSTAGRLDIPKRIVQDSGFEPDEAVIVRYGNNRLRILQPHVINIIKKPIGVFETALIVNKDGRIRINPRTFKKLGSTRFHAEVSQKKIILTGIEDVVETPVEAQQTS